MKDKHISMCVSCESQHAESKQKVQVQVESRLCNSTSNLLIIQFFNALLMCPIPPTKSVFVEDFVKVLYPKNHPLHSLNLRTLGLSEPTILIRGLRNNALPSGKLDC